MKYVFSRYARQPQQVKEAIVLISYESLRFLAFLVLLAALVGIAAVLYRPIS